MGTANTFTHLLAKSCEDTENPLFPETLEGHTAQVVESAEIINSFLSDSLLEILPSEISADIWNDALFCAAWLHDIGKANDHFQTMLRNRGMKQGVRHETLGIIIVDMLLADWLYDFWEKYPLWFKAAVLFSISGHHLKFPDKKSRSGILKSEVTFFGAHAQLANTLKMGQQRFNLSPAPELQDIAYSLIDFDELEIKELLLKMRRHYDEEFSNEEKKTIAMLKSTLMCADLAGSALPANNLPVAKWLKEHLGSVFRSDELEKTIKKKLGRNRLKKFQVQVAQSSGKTILLEAGCGAGKTIGAYAWAVRRAKNRKLFFCYPTTATASEGFCNYLHDPGFEALLIHSRVKTDYQLLENMPTKTPVQRELQHIGIEAVDTWPASAIVCTAHTVLGLLQNTRRGLYAWPSLARAVFIFDEIHSFSDLLFAHLLKFLQVFHHAPILLMTATMPPHRKAALEKVCAVRDGLRIISGPPKREQAQRYLLERSTEEDAWIACRRIIETGGKVLWICNTVQRAMNIARLAEDSGLPVQPYHSRYRYRDRLDRQRKVIDGFEPDQPAMLAVTTQVAEMSLDLSADLLITEYAPVPSLIQRLGRLNRFAEEPEQPAPALFLMPENAMPYAQSDGEEALWQGIDAWLDQVADQRAKSQQDLAGAFLALAEKNCSDTEMPYCDWIDDPWISETNKHAIMEPAYTVEIIREEDQGHRPLAEVAIPMPFPRNKNWAWSNKGRYIIAPAGAIQYDPFWGGRYAEQLDFEII
ncbi:CRISPR-associated helicase Cas3' [Candidatus Electrothrix sp.]|uniref:CRISPR-associated helicase Cas3' n=1 Tax=Candidatus Electrothrix sp. TaxID=2170559 RepID=UPI0040576C7A